MAKLICDNGNGVIYIECEGGEVVGVVSLEQVITEDGISYEGDSIAVLEGFGVEFQQDWENEQTIVDLNCGSRLVFDAEGVRLVQ